MSKRDYYEVLGLSREASDSDIKKAYRQLARKYHPDVNKEPEAEVVFKELSEAYSVLSDSQQRAAYDRFGHEGLNQGGFGGGGFGGFEGFGGLGDIFEAFFGGARGGDPFQSGRGGNRAERGADLRVNLEVDFRDAIFGLEKEISIQHLELCDDCDGLGVERGTQMVNCPMCRGSGQIQQHQRTAFGTFTHIATCPKCQGRGRTAENPCKTCDGQGRSRQKKKLKVKVPPGIDNGVRLCVTGEGDAGAQGGPPGDLYIVLHVKPDADRRFERQEQDLHTKAEITYSQAVLGDKIEVETLEGPTELDIPAGTQPDAIFKLRGKGVPFINNPTSRGDLYVHVQLQVPTRISNEQRELLLNLRELDTVGARKSGDDKHDEHHGFFDKIKDVFKHKDE